MFTHLTEEPFCAVFIPPADSSQKSRQRLRDALSPSIHRHPILPAFLPLEVIRQTGLDSFGKYTEQSMTDKVGRCHKNNFPGRYRMSERPHQTMLLLRELWQCKLWYESHAFTVLHDTHKVFNASQIIAFLDQCSRLQLAELHKLVTETVSLVQ